MTKNLMRRPVARTMTKPFVHVEPAAPGVDARSAVDGEPQDPQLSRLQFPRADYSGIISREDVMRALSKEATQGA